MSTMEEVLPNIILLCMSLI